MKDDMRRVTRINEVQRVNLNLDNNDQTLNQDNENDNSGFKTMLNTEMKKLADKKERLTEQRRRLTQADEEEMIRRLLEEDARDRLRRFEMMEKMNSGKSR